jgi:hypothetical protein
MSHPESAFMVRYLKPLVGCKVKAIKPTDAEFTAIVFETPDGEEIECELASDAEGNRPGFLFGLPRP